MSVSSYDRFTKKGVGWAQETAAVFKILADPTRCKILKLLVHNREGMCVGEIADAVGVSHSATSHQLNGLEVRGVLISIRDGQTICYAIADTRIARNIVRVLKVFFT
jgi:DNA-binding transcriptional ArsR family regulator